MAVAVDMTRQRRVFFADEIEPGVKVLVACRNQYCDMGTTHGRGQDHELTVVHPRRGRSGLSAAVVDEDGTRRSWRAEAGKPVRVRAA